MNGQLAPATHRGGSPARPGIRRLHCLRLRACARATGLPACRHDTNHLGGSVTRGGVTRGRQPPSEPEERDVRLCRTGVGMRHPGWISGPRRPLLHMELADHRRRDERHGSFEIGVGCLARFPSDAPVEAPSQAIGPDGLSGMPPDGTACDLRRSRGAPVRGSSYGTREGRLRAHQEQWPGDRS
jgi:hypothetical protein